MSEALFSMIKQSTYLKDESVNLSISSSEPWVAMYPGIKSVILRILDIFESYIPANQEHKNFSK